MTEPTHEQIESARDAMMRVGAGRFGLSVVEHGMSILDAYEELARAALVAAAGAAPQDNGKCGGCRDLGPHRNVPNCDFYEPPVQAPADTASLIAEARALAGRKVEDSADAEALQIMLGLLCDRLKAPMQVDEAKLAEMIGWEAPGWDSRKELASLFQDHCAIPEEMTLEGIYPALIAVAGYGYELAKEHVLAAAAEQLRGGGR